MKIQYEIVALQVEKMFEDSIALTDSSEINNHFNFIREFIEAAGWTYDGYVDHMMEWNKELTSN